MAQSDVLRRYLDAGTNFTQLTQKRAEAIVADLVKAGEVQTTQASEAVQDLLERSRKTTESLVAQVRGEVRDAGQGPGLGDQGRHRSAGAAYRCSGREEGSGQEEVGREEGSGQEEVGREEGSGQEEAERPARASASSDEARRRPPAEPSTSSSSAEA